MRLFDDAPEMMKRLILDCEKRIDILLVYTKFMLVDGRDLSKEKKYPYNTLFKEDVVSFNSQAQKSR